MVECDVAAQAGLSRARFPCFANVSHWCTAFLRRRETASVESKHLAEIMLRRRATYSEVVVLRIVAHKPLHVTFKHGFVGAPRAS